jgi:hypothetical protein
LDYIEDFEANFSLEEAEPIQGALPCIQFTTGGVLTAAPCLQISVTRRDGSRWCGEIFGGWDELTRILNSPDPDVFVAVAGGVAYAISAKHPQTYRVLALRPVLDTVCAVEMKRLIVVGYTGLLALGPSGQIWKSERLVSDGFSEVRLASSTVIVRGSDAPSGREIEVVVDLTNGEIVARQ